MAVMKYSMVSVQVKMVVSMNSCSRFWILI